MSIAPDQVVSIHYTSPTTPGRSRCSAAGEPLTYLHGQAT
jgi:hypothetical protein